MPSAGWTQADVDALKSAIASGAKSVTYGGPPSRTIEYHSMKEMLDALGVMIADVAAQAGTGASVRFAKHGQGFE